MLIVTIKMGSVSESVCYFLSQGMYLHELKKLCGAKNFITEDRTVDNVVILKDFEQIISYPLNLSAPPHEVHSP